MKISKPDQELILALIVAFMVGAWVVGIGSFTGEIKGSYLKILLEQVGFGLILSLATAFVVGIWMCSSFPE